MLLRHPKRTLPKEVSAPDAKKPRHSMLASGGSLDPTIHVDVTLAPSCSSMVANGTSMNVPLVKCKDGDCEQQEDDRFHDYGKIGLWDNSKWDHHQQEMRFPELDFVSNVNPPLQSEILCSMDMFRDSDSDKDVVWSWVQDRFAQLSGGIMKENAWVQGCFEEREFDLVGVRAFHPMVPPFFLIRMVMGPEDNASDVLKQFRTEIIALVHSNKTAMGVATR